VFPMICNEVPQVPHVAARAYPDREPSGSRRQFLSCHFVQDEYLD